ncbi:NACHT domain-containing protein [Kribbella monticola]|uniref:NACHT domain-containing protein n=1 Tax=Kribbella monticola TaxID=2185285 RepID=UPI001300574F|nr:hypothetical protein [Kribbella monticola]
MSPRPGGESDKIGNRYEGAWTIWHLLQVLRGQGTSVTVEAIGDLADGAEFAYKRATDGTLEMHQLKRQNRTANSWSVKSLQALDIWSKAKFHTREGREFHFISILSSIKLQELCDRARRSDSLDAFVKQWLTKPLRAEFDELAAPAILGSPEVAWTVLRGTWVSWHDERNIIQINSAFAGLLLDGANGSLAALALGDIVQNNLGVTLTASKIEEQLPTYGLARTGTARRNSIADEVDRVTQGWATSVERELLSPPIPRREAHQLFDIAADDSASRVVFLVGTAGGGKSSVLAQLVRDASDSDVPVLAFRLDRTAEFSNTQDLGDKLGLSTSPVAALASIAADESCLLVVDQLDAVSLASGRMPNSFDAIADLIREASAFPNMRIILACRQFDVDNDYRIRNIARSTTVLPVGPLSDEEINTALEGMSLDSRLLTSKQREVLRTPLHLVLLATLAGEPDALAFQTTARLFDAYWTRKRQAVRERNRDVRFNEVVSAVAVAISDSQHLSVLDTVLDRGDLAADADVLISEHVLIRDGRRISFFHETFFDYAFARYWVEENVSLVDFLTATEQDLFRRAQVRQVMHHLRQRDSLRFVSELDAALTSNLVRPHIKVAMLAVVGSLQDPTSAELQLMLKFLQGEDQLGTSAWRAVRTASWFGRMNSDGYLRNWIESNDEVMTNRTLNMLAAGVAAQPDQVANLLAEYCDRVEFPEWIRWVTRFGGATSSRKLFDLILTAIRAGYFDEHAGDLWIAMNGIADQEPAWAVELCSAMLAERPNALILSESGKVSALARSDYAAAEIIKRAAAARPEEYVESIMPFVIEVMRLTSRESIGRGFPKDKHFSADYFGGDPHDDLDEVVFAALQHAIESLAKEDSQIVRPILETLAGLPYDSAQTLLYRGLIAGAAAYAEWAARLLNEGDNRLFCGFRHNSVWVARLLIQAIAGHIGDPTHQALESAVRDLRFEWEGRTRGGYYSFTLLSALDPARLTDVGRRRLGEYQRKFECDQPPEPEGATGGFIESPISDDSAALMNDDHWLKAIERYKHEGADWQTFTGGAHELSNVLRDQTKKDPVRFARFARRLTADMNPAYGSGILIGLAEGSIVPTDAQHELFDCIRHLTGFGHSEIDRWIGHALGRYLKTTPLDVVELLRDRALMSPDPVGSGQPWIANRDPEPGEELRIAGMNSVRGSLAETLGDLMIYDVDGSRTAVIAPALKQMAVDPVAAVRAQVAHAIAAALRFDREKAIDAFWKLVQIDNDEVLAASFVRSLVMYIGNGDSESVVPVITRMIQSTDGDVRESGGELAAFAALEWLLPDALGIILSGSDERSRQGVARICAERITATRSVDLAQATLIGFFDDPNETVRELAAGVAATLRGSDLRPFESILLALIDSKSFEASTPQIFLALEEATERVDGVALRCAQRFVEVSGSSAGDIRTRAAADAGHVSNLVVRGLAQTREPAERAALLDVVDDLVMSGAYGIDEAIEAAGR